jgi:hypothetical protein
MLGQKARWDSRGGVRENGNVFEERMNMKKWGVRLIGCGFIVWAISNLYNLITGTAHIKGFMGFDLVITYNGNETGILAWVGVYILCYAGIQLIRLDIRGRTWALIMFWPATVFMGIFFLITVFSSIFSWPLGSSIIFPFFNFQWSGEITGPIMLPLVAGLLFIFNAIPLYFLTREDIKRLFLKNEMIEGQI